MPDAVYDQVLTIAAPQIKTLADAVESYLTQEADLTPRLFDWDDIDQHCPAISVRYSDGGAIPAQNMASTNSSNAVGFPVFVVMVSPKGVTRDAEAKAWESLRQSIREYYHHRRRMETVSYTGWLSSTSTVQDSGPSPPADFSAKHKIQIMTLYFWFLEPQTA